MPNQTSSFCLVLNTCPDEQTARAMALGLIEARLAACVNLVPGLTSIYRWEGAVEEGTELLLLIKTTAERYPQVESFIRERHPYRLAEIISMPLSAGLPAYLDWIGDSVRAETVNGGAA